MDKQVEGATSVVKVLLTLGGIIAILIVFAIYQSYMAAQPYSIDDIYYKTGSSEHTYSVKIDNIRKEKDKEDIYEFTISINEENNKYHYSYSLPASQYDQTIGIENNAITTTRYYLTYGVQSKGDPTYDNYYIHIRRFDFLGQPDFTNDEIKELANKSLDIFTRHSTLEKSYIGRGPKLEDEVEWSDYVSMTNSVSCDLSSSGGKSGENGMNDMLPVTKLY